MSKLACLSVFIVILILPVKSIFGQYETKTVKRATLPGIKISGGEETEPTQMYHRTAMYHFPSSQSIKEGYLVAVNIKDPFDEMVNAIDPKNPKSNMALASGTQVIKVRILLPFLE